MPRGLTIVTASCVCCSQIVTIQLDCRKKSKEKKKQIQKLRKKIKKNAPKRIYIYMWFSAKVLENGKLRGGEDAVGETTGKVNVDKQ